MAQILKEEFRKAIIDAAKKEFALKGYKNASMRSIAKNANMTVGNLYRYFKSKEEINLYIVAPTFKKIDALLKNISNNDIQNETRVFNVKPDRNKLEKIIRDFSTGMVYIYSDSPEEFNILLLHSRINEDITKWITNLIYTMISDDFIMSNFDVHTLAEVYSEAIFKGLQEIFRKSNNDSLKLISMLETYLNSFIYTFDNDFRKFVK